MIMNITGRLTRDAEIRNVAGDRQVVNFSLAINDNYRNRQGERVEQTTFFDCAYWISTNVAKLLTKGTLVELTGRVYARAWQGNDGQAHAGLNFHTSEIKLHGGGKRISGEQGITEADKTYTKKQGEADDLPF